MSLFFLAAVTDPFTARDASGNALGAARLRFLRSGTTAPKAAYSDEALTTAITDSDGDVSADANGEFATIYMATDNDYRVQLFDADDQLRFDVDPYDLDPETGRNVFRNPTVQALSESDGTVPGATLTFYATGTSDPKNVYADPDLKVPLTNPVKADAGGFFPPIYLEAGQYRVVPSWTDEIDPYPVIGEDHSIVMPAGFGDNNIIALQFGIPDTNQDHFTVGEMLVYWGINDVTIDGESIPEDGPRAETPNDNERFYHKFEGEWFDGTPDPDDYEIRLDIIDGQDPATGATPTEQWVDMDTVVWWRVETGANEAGSGEWFIRIREKATLEDVALYNFSWSITT